jgi:hypothetical protein
MNQSDPYSSAPEIIEIIGTPHYHKIKFYFGR